MIVQELRDKRLISPPDWLPTNTVYLTIAGSMSYGVSTDTSDFDVYGITIPPIKSIFAHLDGYIDGFSNQRKRFDVWQEAHVFDKDALGGKGREYDFQVYSIVRFFRLAMENNPNILDCLFVPVNCVLHSTTIGGVIRENRHKFLSKNYYHKSKGYAFAQMSKIKTKGHKGLDEVIAFEKDHGIPQSTTFQSVKDELERRSAEGCLAQLGSDELKKYHDLYSEMVGLSSRAEKVKIQGFDTKFGMHLVRLLDQCEQVLVSGTLDLQKNREQLKAIRRGDMTEEDIMSWANDKERVLENLYTTSTAVPYAAPEAEIKGILLNCLEQHYGSLEKVIVEENRAIDALRNIRDELAKVQNML